MDINLKFLALEELYYKDQEIKEQIDAINTLELHQLVYGNNPKYKWFDCIPEMASLLSSIEIPDDKLKKVTTLSGEACHLHHMIMPNWDGEGDEFDMSSLSGVEKMTHLKQMSFINFESIKDAELLLGLDLEKISEFSGLSEELLERLNEKGVTLD